MARPNEKKVCDPPLEKGENKKAGHIYVKGKKNTICVASETQNTRHTNRVEKIGKTPCGKKPPLGKKKPGVEPPWGAPMALGKTLKAHPNDRFAPLFESLAV